MQERECKTLFISFFIILYNSFFSKHIKFGVLTPQEIVELAEIEVCNRELYNVATRAPVKFGCLDRRLVKQLCIVILFYFIN